MRNRRRGDENFIEGKTTLYLIFTIFLILLNFLDILVPNLMENMFTPRLSSWCGLLHEGTGRLDYGNIYGCHIYHRLYTIFLSQRKKEYKEHMVGYHIYIHSYLLICVILPFYVDLLYVGTCPHPIFTDVSFISKDGEHTYLYVLVNNVIFSVDLLFSSF